MIITKLIGGLGNQMFQYAIGRHLAIKNNTEFAMDLSGYKNQNPKDTPRDYALGIFNVQETFASEESLIPFKINKYQKKLKKFFPFIKKNYILETDLSFDPKILKLKGNILLHGYWQSEKYFQDIRDILIKDFSLKNPLTEEIKKLKEKIASINSISIHIRRGDYISNKYAQAHHGSCTPKYYEKAIELIKGKVNGVAKEGGLGRQISYPHFFVFSDDIEWCKENIKAEKITFVSNGQIKDYEEMHLMSQCKHNIIANSSFSWWGAWLNQNKDKIVIAPSKWLNNPKAKTQDIIPDTWSKI